jgi:ribonuclease BN (tRNA processing enzyme)
MKNHDVDVRLDRRRILKGALGLAAGATLGTVFQPRVLAQTAAAGPGKPPALPAGTHLVLLGTRGAGGVDLARGQTASAVVVDGVPYLFDCGYGTLRALVASHVGLLPISSVFLSHLPNDHTTDLVALLSEQWTGGKTTPTNVYGGHGTAALVQGALAFLRPDVEIRTVSEGRTTKPEAMFVGHDVAATATPTPVLKDERVTVTAVENSHFSESAKARMAYRSLSFRIDSAKRSIVFSGDTGYSKNLVGLARGVDLFVCEILAQNLVDMFTARAKADAAAGKKDSLAREVLGAYTSPVDVGRMAAEAQVKTVVVYHQLTGPRAGALDYPVSAFIDGIRAQFGGQVVVGQDLMVL